MAAPQPERLHALDAVRGFALLVVVFFHGAASFWPGPDLWSVRDTSHSSVLSVLSFIQHMFILTTFFVLAGFFARMSFHRLGEAAFIRDRALRIGVPLVVGFFVSGILVLGLAHLFSVLTYGVHPPYHPLHPWEPQPFVSLLMQFWFLYVLILQYAVTLALHRLVEAIDRSARLRGLIDQVVRFTVNTGVAPFLLALPIFSVFALRPHWQMWFGIPTVDLEFPPNILACVGYGVGFAFGWVLQRQPALLQVIQRLWPIYTTLAAALVTYCLFVVGPAPVINFMPPQPVRLAYAAAYALAAWCGTFATLGLALRFMSGPSPWRRYLAKASYWMFLAHVPLVLGLQIIASQIHTPWWIEYPLVMAITMAVLLFTYEHLVRYTALGGLLNGKRDVRRTPAAAAASTA